MTKVFFRLLYIGDIGAEIALIIIHFLIVVALTFAHVAIDKIWGVKLQNKIGLQTQTNIFFLKNFLPLSAPARLVFFPERSGEDNQYSEEFQTAYHHLKGQHPLGARMQGHP